MTWVRNSAKPKQRRLVLVYKPDDPRFEALETFVSKMPYRGTTPALLSLLEVICKQKLAEGHAITPVTLTDAPTPESDVSVPQQASEPPSSSPAAPAALPSSPATPAQPSKTTERGSSSGYSRSSSSFFNN